jgi:hypothetical protein
LHFAPYGFRATWHHLVVSAGLPVWLHDDSDSLVRAVDELEQARGVWMVEAADYETRRRREKRRAVVCHTIVIAGAGRHSGWRTARIRSHIRSSGLPSWCSD